MGEMADLEDGASVDPTILDDESSTWRVKAGQVIKIKELENSHLINIINLLWRNASKIKSRTEVDMLRAIGMLQGEMAMDCADRDLNALMKADPEEWIFTQEKFKELCAEAKRRDIHKLTQLDESWWEISPDDLYV